MSFAQAVERIRRVPIWLAAAAVWLAALPAAAAEFSVSPIRLFFERGTRSAVVNVTNDSKQPLRMQLRLFEWTQDAGGQDVYRDSDDLVYFPKLMTIEPGEKRLVRIGPKGPGGAGERSYRLFLDELRDDAKPQSGSAAVTFSIRFALPIFLVPAEAKPRGEIEALSLEAGVLKVTVANPGNQHFRIETLRAEAGGAPLKEIGGWYLLPGARRVHQIEIPADACARLRRIDIAVKADKISTQRALDVDPRMCQR